MLKYAFRDFFRRRRISKHRSANGDMYAFHGLQISLPQSVDVGVCNALLRGKYEVEESAMIRKYLPRGLPVIELGGSLGVVSTLVRSMIGPETRHVIVEANPAIIDICRINAARYAHDGAVDVVNAAIGYGTKVAHFGISKDIHTSSLTQAGDQRPTIEVPCIELNELHKHLGSPEQFALVSDIEGAEYQIFEQDADVLEKVSIAIIELHPSEYSKHGGSLEALLQRCQALGFRLLDQEKDVFVFAGPGH